MSASSADTSSPDPSVAAAPSSPAAADSISPTINANYRATFISLLAGAVGLVAVGQQIFTRGLNSRAQGTPFIGAGMFLFVLAREPAATPTLKSRASDVTKPLDAAPNWSITGSQAAFVFLPEREKELDWVRSRYPGGTLQRFYANDGQRLFLLYELRISP